MTAFNSFADVQNHWAQVGSNVTITDPFGGSIVIENVTIGNLASHQALFLV